MEKPLSDVLIETAGGVLAITFNRPEQLNAVNATMLHSAPEAIGVADESVRVVVITGVDRAFSSGADLSAADMGARPSTGPTT
jgi:enoyl-CoA hydratase